MPAFIVRLIGLLFLLPGIFGIVTYLLSLFSRKSILRPTFPLMSIGSVFLGVYLEMYPASFVAYLVILLGVILLIAGINQLISMITNRNISPFSWILMLLPLGLIGVGGYCVTHSYEAAETVFKLLGATCIYYALSDMFLTLRAKHYSKIVERERKKAEEAERRAREAEYVDFQVINTNEIND